MRLTHSVALFIVALPFAASCDLLSGAECSADGDCPGQQFCVESKCVECKTDTDCDDRDQCTDGSCERRIAEGEGASEGEGGAGGEGEGGAGGEGEGGAGGEGEGGVGGEGEGEGGAALEIQLAWADVGADVDLHATKGTPYCVDDGTTGATTTFGPFSEAVSTPCSPNLDCNYSSCRGDGLGGGQPDWDGTGAGTVTAGDPLLLNDSNTGATPEVMQVVSPVAGTYLVGAFYFNNTVSPGPATSATLTVRSRGITEKIVTTSLATNDTWQDLAIVHVDSFGGVECVGDVTDGIDECP